MGKIDSIKVTDDYISQTDWRVRENSNVTLSIGGLILAQTGAVSSDYWLTKVYTDEIAKAHKDCDIHLHDLCFEASAEFFLANGKTISFEEAEENGITTAIVKTYDEESNTFVNSQAVNIGKRALNRELIRITLNDGTILPLCEPTHKFLTKNRGYVEAQGLVDDDILVNYN